MVVTPDGDADVRHSKLVSLQIVVAADGARFMRKSFMNETHGQCEFRVTQDVSTLDAAQGSEHTVRVWRCTPEAKFRYAFMTELGDCDLATFLADPRRAPAAISMIPSLIDALALCHAAGYYHGDVKPANIIISRKGSPMLSDYGLSRPIIDIGSDVRNKLPGTNGYRFLWACQGAAGKAVAADWWAMAVLVSEIVTGQKLFTRTALAELSSPNTTQFFLTNYLVTRGVPGLAGVIVRDLDPSNISCVKRCLATFGATAQQGMLATSGATVQHGMPATFGATVKLGMKRPHDNECVTPPAPKRSKSWWRDQRRKAAKRRRQEAAAAVAPNPMFENSAVD